MAAPGKIFGEHHDAVIWIIDIVMVTLLVTWREFRYSIYIILFGEISITPFGRRFRCRICGRISKERYTANRHFRGHKTKRMIFTCTLLFALFVYFLFTHL